MSSQKPRVIKGVFMKRAILISIVAILFAVNIVAYNHAYKFTHFNTEKVVSTAKPENLGLMKKLGVLFTGITNPRPYNKDTPTRPYEEVLFTSFDHNVSAWRFPVDVSKGTVILFHGYRGTKSSLLKNSDAFNDLGYSTMIIDFYGSGDSDGSTTSIGYWEAENVADAYHYLQSKGEENIFLFGVSMGAVSIIRAVSQLNINPSAVILECPYGRLLNTVQNRFELMGVPSAGFAELLVLWGGFQNDFWAFDLNTVEYAKSLNVPTLILHGSEDPRAKLHEVQEVYDQIPSEKKLVLFESLTHEAYIKVEPQMWKREVASFLSR